MRNQIYVDFLVYYILYVINYNRKPFLLNKLLNPLLLYLTGGLIKLYKPPIYNLICYLRVIVLVF